MKPGKVMTVPVAEKRATRPDGAAVASTSTAPPCSASISKPHSTEVAKDDSTAARSAASSSACFSCSTPCPVTALVRTTAKVHHSEVVAQQGGLCVTRGGNRFLTLTAGYLGSLVWGGVILTLENGELRPQASRGDGFRISVAVRDRVVGQDHALDMISRRIQTSRANLDNPVAEAFIKMIRERVPAG